MSGAEINADHVSELRRLGLDYWWYAVRRAHVDEALSECARDGPPAYLDFGCGTGTLTQHVIRRFRPARALGLDGTAAALETAAARGLPVRRVDFREPLELDFAPTAITALDVLEHLDDPARALRNLSRAAAPGARLVVTAPAMPALWSRWDEVSGHRRRYTRRGLRAELSASGWIPIRVRYFFSYCVPPAWVERRLLRRVRRFEFPDVPPAANALLTAAGELERRLRCPFPFGTSLLATARRA